MAAIEASRRRVEVLAQGDKKDKIHVINININILQYNIGS